MNASRPSAGTITGKRCQTLSEPGGAPTTCDPAIRAFRRK